MTTLPPINTEVLGTSCAPTQANKMPKMTSSKASREISGALRTRAHKTDSNPLLLKTNMGAGHGGASGRYDAIREGAFNMAWMLSQWGIGE